MTPDMQARVEAELRREGYIPDDATPEQVAATLRTYRGSAMAFRLACGDVAVELTAVLGRACEAIAAKARRVRRRQP